MSFRLSLSSVAVLMSSVAFAQDLPSDEELLFLLSGSLPPYWAVSELEVVATSRGGDASRPEAIVRFEADAAPKQDLFALTGKEGPYYLVVNTEAAQETRRLYGFHELAYSAGNWSGPVTIENPVNEFGQPLDLFAGPTLEVGTDEATERLEAIRNTALTGTIAAQEAELIALRAAHEKTVAELRAANSRAVSELSSNHARDLAQLSSANDTAVAAAESELVALRNQHEKVVTDFRAEHSRALSELTANQARELSELNALNEAAAAEVEAQGIRQVEEARRGYDTELARLTTEREPLVAEARAALEKLLSDEKRKSDEALAAQREAAAAELEQLRSEHAARRGALIEQQRQEMAEIETALATERQSLQRQVETADATIALQQRLLASLKERATGSDAVLAAFNQASEARRAFFARLPQYWSGQVRCESVESGFYSYTGPVSIGLSEAASTTGRSGEIAMMNRVWDGRSSYPSISLAVLDDGLTFPLSLRARITPWNRNEIFPLQPFSVIDFTVSQDGRMQGAATQPLTVDQVSREVTCTYLLGEVGQ